MRKSLPSFFIPDLVATLQGSPGPSIPGHREKGKIHSRHDIYHFAAGFVFLIIRKKPSRYPKKGET
jgi:hypothetical protein